MEKSLTPKPKCEISGSIAAWGVLWGFTVATVAREVPIGQRGQAVSKRPAKGLQ